MKRSAIRQIIREEILREGISNDLKQLEGKTIKNIDHDPYVGTFTIQFTDGTSVELGSTGFSHTDGDELRINLDDK